MFRRVFTLFVLGAVLAGCAPAPTRPAAPLLDRDLESRLAALGPRERLAYLDALTAQSHDPGERAVYQLLAMELLMAHGRAEDVAQRLARLDPRALPTDQRYRVALLEAQLELARDRAPVALQKLPAWRADAPWSIRSAWLRTRAIALARLGRLEESLQLRLELDRLLRSEAPEQNAAIEDNHLVIWSQLQALGTARRMALRGRDPVLDGWLDLAGALAGAEDGTARRRAIDAWRQRHPDHPAVTTLSAVLRDWVTYPETHPSQVAVLLPASGPLADAGAALRDALMAAWYRMAPSERPTLRFYDSGGDEPIADRYREAVADGAGLVIGPLHKARVTELIESGRLSVPVLALNQVELVDPAVVQFGLNPEDEAWAAADLAMIRGQRRAILFAPAGAWGDRLAGAFRAHYEALGGTLLAVERYAETSDDHRHAIQRAFNVLQSEQRRRRVEALVGRRLVFEPRRREDVQAVMLIASPRQARNLRAQLKFYNAGDLPTYGTAGIWSGRLQPELDRDLDGVWFPDMPWLLVPESRPLRGEIEALWPQRLAAQPRLWALGVDAWALVPQLARLRALPDARLDGASGVLRLDADGRVRRELAWARFRGGRPQPIADPLETTTAATPTTDEEDTPPP